MNSGETNIQAETKPARLRKLTAWIKFLLFLFVTALAILIAGFIIFATRVDNLQTPEIGVVPKADGIVVWTGTGGGRLDAGTDLLQNDKGERLLISGVNADLKPDTLFNLLQLPEEIKNCCVDLDYVAKDTIGNARETASWAEALGYDHILLVTSSYHMPRAQSEIRAAVGQIRITPYPVSRLDDSDWYSDTDRFNRLMQEYAKLLLSMARGAEISHRDAPNMPLPMTEKQG